MYNGDIINSLLKERAIKKKDLVEYLGTSNYGLEAIIHGNPTVKNIDRIATFFSVSVDTFFTEESDNQYDKCHLPGRNRDEMPIKSTINKQK